MIGCLPGIPRNCNKSKKRNCRQPAAFLKASANNNGVIKSLTLCKSTSLTSRCGFLASSCQFRRGRHHVDDADDDQHALSMIDLIATKEIHFHYTKALG